MPNKNDVMKRVKNIQSHRKLFSRISNANKREWYDTIRKYAQKQYCQYKEVIQKYPRRTMQCKKIVTRGANVNKIWCLRAGRYLAANKTAHHFKLFSFVRKMIFFYSVLVFVGICFRPQLDGKGNLEVPLIFYSGNYLCFTLNESAVWVLVFFWMMKDGLSGLLIQEENCWKCPKWTDDIWSSFNFF